MFYWLTHIVLNSKVPKEKVMLYFQEPIGHLHRRDGVIVCWIDFFILFTDQIK